MYILMYKNTILNQYNVFAIKRSKVNIGIRGPPIGGAAFGVVHSGHTCVVHPIGGQLGHGGLGST